VDQRDNDPAVLLTYIAAALDRVEPIDPRVIRGLAGPVASIVGAVPRLAAAMAAMTGPVALVLDHLELLENQACLDVVAELAAQLPTGAQLLVASRARPPLPVALLRVQGRVLEVGVQDLAMDHQEARALLEGAGVGLDDAAVNDLLRRTEGWPVGCTWPRWPTRRAAPAAMRGPGSPAMTGSWPTTCGRECWARFHPSCCRS
jgi:LuxR family maltose regulon positive regulatory protein